MIVENAKLFITNPVEPVAPPANPTEGDGFNQLLESLRTPTDDSNGGALGAIEPRDRNRRDQPDDDASRQSEPRNESPDAAERADAAAPTDRDTSADESDQPAETNSEDQNTEPVAAEPTGRDAEKPADTESDAADSTDISAASQSVQVAKPDAADPLRLIVPRDPAPKQAQPTQPQTETVVSNQAAQRAAAATAQSVTPQTNTATPETQTNAQNAPNTAQESVRRAPVAEVQPQARPQPQAQPTDARTANQVAPQPTSRDSETESARPRTPAPTPVQSSPIQDRSDQPAYRDSANRDAAQRDTADPDTRRSNAPQTRQLPADAQVTVERPAPRANQALDQPARPDAAATPDQSARAALATITNTESATPTTTQIATDTPDAASAARAASQSSAAANAGAAPSESTLNNNRELEPARVTEQVLRGMRGVTNQRGGSLTIRLQPPDLGSLRIDVRMTGAVVHVAFDASTDAVRDLLARQMSTLRQSLESQGLTVERINIQAPLPESNPSAPQDEEDTDADGRSRGQFRDDPSDQRNQDTPADDNETSRFERELIDMMA